jgi:hypothetical protein
MNTTRCQYNASRVSNTLVTIKNNINKYCQDLSSPITDVGFGMLTEFIGPF